MKNIKHDFDALKAEIFRANVHNVNSETGFMYGVDYPHAIAMAIERGEHAMLIKLLEAKELIHPCLYPSLADAIRALQT